MSVIIEELSNATAAERPVEVVERKGRGHPDTICDMLSEGLSVALSKYYLREFGFILHHNVDKVLLVGGRSRTRFGGGSILEPMRILLSGRATQDTGGKHVPVASIAEETGRAWFRENMRAVDWNKSVVFEPLLRPGSADLVGLFERQRKSGISLANDTSCGVGFAPSTTLEQVVLAIETTLNSAETKIALPMVGEDIKVMGVRQGSDIGVTVSCAFIDRYLSGIEDYLHAKECVQRLAHETAAVLTSCPVEIQVNAADAPESASLFLTVSGTSGEAGDDGETGRGNRGNGLITPCRPMTMEAMAGKNPVTHVGKLYNAAAMRIAERLVAEVDSVREAECMLVSRIGAPIDQPHFSHVRVKAARLSPTMRSHIGNVVADEIRGIPELWRAFLGIAR